jgi:hypothetical protein
LQTVADARQQHNASCAQSGPAAARWDVAVRPANPPTTAKPPFPAHLNMLRRVRGALDAFLVLKEKHLPFAIVDLATVQ